MNIEGANLTPKMIDNLRYLQEGPESLSVCVDTFNNAITFVAERAGSDINDAAKGLQIISGLCYVRDILVSFCDQSSKETE